MIYKVNLVWDNAADVWIATSEDIDGLILESGSIDALIERVKITVPELLKLNGYNQNAKISIHSERLIECVI